MLIAKAPLHRDHPTVVHIHRDKSPLDFGDLAQAPTQKTSVGITGHLAHQYDISNAQKIASRFSQWTNLAVFIFFARPFNIFGDNPVTVFVIFHAFDANTGVLLAHHQNHRRPPFMGQNNITANLSFCQCRAPAHFFLQLRRVNRQAAAVPDATSAIIVF